MITLIGLGCGEQLQPIAKEKIECPIFSKDHFKMALNNYRKLDITKFEGKRKILL